MKDLSAMGAPTNSLRIGYVALTQAALALVCYLLPLSAKAEGACSRIVSLAPSLTEVAFALGLGSSVVGVSRYSAYPPEAARAANVGGLLDPNIEAIIALSPSTVLALVESKEKLRNLGIFDLHPVYVDHRTIHDILSSIRTVGSLCGVERQAHALIEKLQSAIERTREVTANLESPKVMIVVGGESSQGNLRNVFISGSDGYYSELLSIARGRNVLQGVTAPASGMSLEGIIALNPDIIIEVQPPSGDREATLQSIRNAWSQLPSIAAVHAGAVYLLDGDYATIPGPRFDLLLHELVELLHGRDVAQKTSLRHD